MPRQKAKSPSKNPTAPKRTGTAKHTADKKHSQRAQTDLPFARTHKASVFFYGRHSVIAALSNPRRQCLHLIATERGLRSLDLNERLTIKITRIDNDLLLDRLIGDASPHQGLALEVMPLPEASLDDLKAISGRRNILLMLDQVTDPHNVGACMRSAAALGANGLITQDKNSPMEAGTLARSSSGALEKLPWHRAINLAKTLEALRDMGYWSVGLDGSTDQTIRDVRLGDNIVIVMGSEGKGLRPLVRKHCDMIAKIPMTGLVESLNVSNAAAIALYECGMR